MPQCVGLICPISCTQEFIEAVLANYWSVDYVELPSGRIDLQLRALTKVEGVRCSVTISELDQALSKEDYLDNEELPAQFKNALGCSRFYSLSFNVDLDLVKQVLKAILLVSSGTLDRMWMDDDYGRIVPGTVLLERLLSQPNWDWRHNGN